MNKTPFQISLESKDEFTLSFELVPGPGGKSTKHSQAMAKVKDIAADGRIKAVSITDNPGGHPSMTPEVIGREIKDIGLDVISHFSCKDKNRNKMESLLYGWDRANLRNLLVITGDYPQKGFCGHPKPVFDLDSVQTTALISCLNREQNNKVGIMPTSFFVGVAISPFKYSEAELVMQYYKLHRKIGAGADFAITQLGFDLRKYHELLLYSQEQELKIPFLANVFLPNLTIAKLMFNNRIPGCIMPEEVLTMIAAEAKSADKGRKARLVRGAKQLAVLQGLGYAGAHIGGPNLNMVDLDLMFKMAKGYEGQWQDLIKDQINSPKSSTFYYYQQDPENGLNQAVETLLEKRGPQTIGYHFSDLLHKIAFEKKSPAYKTAKMICLALNNSPLKKPLQYFEHISKFILFSCQNCGDCTISQFGYHCPQAGCAKYLLNGPCGGSVNGWCEVYPNERKCYFVKAYQSLKKSGKAANMAQGFTPPRDWQLANTSSWVNYYQGKDNNGRECCSSK